jgi:hypothetical protein
MKIRLLLAFVIGLALGAPAWAQDANPAPPAGQNSGQNSGMMNSGRGYGRRGMMGAGVMGTVTETAAGHYTIKTFTGETCTVRFNDNTRIFKQRAAMGGEGGGMGMGGNPPEQIKPTDIKVGDAIESPGRSRSRVQLRRRHGHCSARPPARPADA